SRSVHDSRDRSRGALSKNQTTSQCDQSNNGCSYSYEYVQICFSPHHYPLFGIESFSRVRLPTLVEAAESRFGAFVGDRQKALYAFIADYIRMSITGFSLRQCGQLLLGSVGIGMVGQDDVGTRP